MKQEMEVHWKATSAKGDRNTPGSCPACRNMFDGEVKEKEKKHAQNNPKSVRVPGMGRVGKCL